MTTRETILRDVQKLTKLAEDDMGLVSMLKSLANELSSLQSTSSDIEAALSDARQFAQKQSDNVKQIQSMLDYIRDEKLPEAFPYDENDDE